MATKPKPGMTEQSIPQQPEAPISGTGDPQTDLAVVQSAVDNAGGSPIHLSGTFDFGTGQVIIKGRADISGVDKFGARAVIKGGKKPFLVDSNTQPVTIRDLHFLRPAVFAIHIKSVAGLVVANCKIEGPITP